MAKGKYKCQDEYFASLDFFSQKYLDALVNKVSSYREYIAQSGKASVWKKSIQNYFGVSSDGNKKSTGVTRGGDSGQYVMAKVNDYRNLIQHQLILITSQRPAGQAKAINSDPESLHQARIGSLLTEYYLSQVGWEQRFIRAAEISLFADEAFHVLEWDANQGDAIRPKVDPQTQEPTGQMVMTGDSELRIIGPWAMARDPYLNDAQAMQWGIYNYRVNKFDLIAQYPEAELEILAGAGGKLKNFEFDRTGDAATDTDQTTVFCLSHEPTPACPQGRTTLFIPDKILLDGPFPYPEFNIYRTAQNDIVESCFGYTNNRDLLALEEVTDALNSIIISNQTTFGAQAIIGPTGSKLTHIEISKGFAYFEVDPAHIDRIKPLQLTKTAPEIFAFLQTLGTKKETIAGINSVVRGDPEGALRANSGSALALVQAQSLQFNSGGQRSFYHSLSKVNTGHIKLLQKYADSEKVIRVTGKVQGQYLKEFKYDKDTLTNVSSVVFEMVDAAFQSIGGKISVADNLLQKNLIKNARQYLTVVRTGSLDAFTEDDEVDEISLKEEQEKFREYEPVEPLAGENSEEKIKSAMSVIASPDAKKDQKLVGVVLDFVQKHVDMWVNLSQSNPALLIATGQKVLPPPPSNGLPPSPTVDAGQPPVGGNVPPHGPPAGHSPAQIMSGQPPVQTKAGEVKQPQMPMNPATKQRVPLPQPPV